MVAERPARLAALVVCLALLGCGARPEDPLAGKRVVGPVETVRVVEADLLFRARVDTGAASTSINARDIAVEGAAPGDDPDGHVGRRIRFTVVDGEDRAARVESVVRDVRTVRSADAREARYYVELTIEHDGRAAPVLVNLNDRSRSSYKLLLGRNWLAGRYVVDVDR